MGEKQKMTVSLDSDVIKALKIAAVNNSTNVSAILEQLARKYLEANKR